MKCFSKTGKRIEQKETSNLSFLLFKNGRSSKIETGETIREKELTRLFS